jgi:hypothetical protein
MSESVYDLQRLGYRDLVRRWEDVARETPATPERIYEEIARRNVARVNNLLLLFTVVVTVASVAALGIALINP